MTMIKKFLCMVLVVYLLYLIIIRVQQMIGNITIIIIYSFPLNGNKKDPEVYGLEGIMNIY